ncbi:MAG TPA: exo-alpha-sialidase, partial [Beijerinckiaceae bacterium]
MADKVLVLIGTRKGAFILRSDADRRDWRLSGPFGDTSPMNHVIADPASGILWGGGGSEWFGPAVWRSDDLGETWTHSREGLKFADGQAPMTSVWSLASAHGVLWAGV